MSTLNESQLLKKPWQPMEDFKFPFLKHVKREKKSERFENHQHSEKYSWLAFYKSKQGFFCTFLHLVQNLLENQVIEKLTEVASIIRVP